jgi:hypothetical protein
MIHCHNLPHEDHDMMAQFSVGYNPNDPDPNDPIEAAKPHPIGQVPSTGGETTQPTESTGGTDGGSVQPTETAAPVTTQPAAPATAEPTVQTDVVAITTARHRLNKDITFAGTSKYTGTAAGGSVVLYDVTPGRAATRIGTATVNALGNWSWTTKPGPSRQVTAVRADSSRGGTATATVRTS